jgi:hypothetical protein
MEEFGIIISFFFVVAIVLFGSCALMTMDSCIDFNHQAVKTLKVIENKQECKRIYNVPPIVLDLKGK